MSNFTTTFRNVQRKLHALELDHLRALVAEQQARIEQLYAELQVTQHNAEFWYDQANAAWDEGGQENAHPVIGLLKTGELLVLEARS